ncbi:TPA: hypothetical protein HA246_07620 [Candidatus Woesearchaeota archaeon]|nr:hypothetical protein [Candidatus Woesearchaeota archaeon]
MVLAYTTKTSTNMIIDKVKDKITLELLKKDSLKEIFSGIDQEIKKKNIKFTRVEAVKDDLYY